MKNSHKKISKSVPHSSAYIFPHPKPLKRWFRPFSPLKKCIFEDFLATSNGPLSTLAMLFHKPFLPLPLRIPKVTIHLNSRNKVTSFELMVIYKYNALINKSKQNPKFYNLHIKIKKKSEGWTKIILIGRHWPPPCVFILIIIYIQH